MRVFKNSYIFRMSAYVSAIVLSFWKNIMEVLYFAICPFQCIGLFCTRRVLGLSVSWNMRPSSVPTSMGLSVLSFHVNLSVERFVSFNMFF